MTINIVQNFDRMEINTSGAKSIIIGIILTILGLDSVYTSYTHNDSLTIMCFGTLFVVIGIGLIFFAKKRNIVINKDGSTIITDRYLIGASQPKIESITTNTITAVSLSTRINQNKTGSSGTTTRVSKLSLLLRNNDMIHILESSGAGLSIFGFNFASFISKAPLSKEAEQIAAFLNVPLKANDHS